MSCLFGDGVFFLFSYMLMCVFKFSTISAPCEKTTCFTFNAPAVGTTPWEKTDRPSCLIKRTAKTNCQEILRHPFFFTIQKWGELIFQPSRRQGVIYAKSLGSWGPEAAEAEPGIFNVPRAKLNLPKKKTSMISIIYQGHIDDTNESTTWMISTISMKSIDDVSDTNINDQQMCIYTYIRIYIYIHIDVIYVHINYVHINDTDDITTSPQPSATQPRNDHPSVLSWPHPWPRRPPRRRPRHRSWPVTREQSPWEPTVSFIFRSYNPHISRG